MGPRGFFLRSANRRRLLRALAMPPRLCRFRAGQSVEQIARERDVTTNTIFGHLAEGVERGEPLDLQAYFSVAELAEVAAAFGRQGFGALSQDFESLGGRMDYGRLRLFRAAANARKQ